MEEIKNDERLQNNSKAVNSLGYHILLLGIFGVLIYRWFFLKQSLMETLDIFIVMNAGVIATFLLHALNGIPSHFPVNLSPKERLFFMTATPLFSAIVAFFASYLVMEEPQFKIMLRSSAIAAGAVILLLTLYALLLKIWEKRNLED